MTGYFSANAMHTSAINKIAKMLASVYMIYIKKSSLKKSVRKPLLSKSLIQIPFKAPMFWKCYIQRTGTELQGLIANGIARLH